MKGGKGRRRGKAKKERKKERKKAYFGGLGDTFAKDFDFDIAESSVQCD